MTQPILSSTGARACPIAPSKDLLTDSSQFASTLSDCRLANKISQEIELACSKLKSVGKTCTIFGSARIPASDPICGAAEHLGFSLASAGLSVITGGGPSIMLAANCGAYSAYEQGLASDTASIGFNIKLPFEEEPNHKQNIALYFNHFASRKVCFSKFANSIVVFPGGFGSLDELFEVLVLAQCKKAEDTPIILFDSSFWGGLLFWIESELLSRGLISKNDLSLIKLADSVDQVLSILGHKK